ncbi:uncharacterized protein LOC18011268 isoform X2 [Eutrema salsugineum]|uniref:uncharacterized protein LOC18011268 isoform X2 n=1 Tax=Eutrema salsugineum TaxID=72664 RepID=UPI000CED3AE7|nr:uncharacterized protein LOC18011268 isoform X2 [Eutrema salsugineum]
MCTVNPPPLTIENLKTHQHTLTLFPRGVPLPCDACGFSLDAIFDQVYSCLLCNYVIHRRCIYLPRVIKLTRHLHRLSPTSSIVPYSGVSPCGVCHKPVDVNYGKYSCNKGCDYAIHSKCATKTQVWNEIDLERVPEEEEEVLEPFVRIDEETIQHFSHDHQHLKIQGNDNRGDHENKFCQACVLPMTVSDRFYSCIYCDFVLHEACTSLPRKQHLPVHKHSLTLFHPSSSPPRRQHNLVFNYQWLGLFYCNGCRRNCCGFMYKCTENKCDYQLGVSFTQDERRECLGCWSHCSSEYLECIKCNFVLGFKCATLPSLVHYKHDKHPLTLCCGEKETTNLKYWCEICEEELEPSAWFYTCNSCLVTLHVTCLLGNEIYFKPNHGIRRKIDSDKVDIARNNGHTRPACDFCQGRCVDTLVFKESNRTFCTWVCALQSLNS